MILTLQLVVGDKVFIRCRVCGNMYDFIDIYRSWIRYERYKPKVIPEDSDEISSEG